jgi:type I restriction enzyme M protein
VVSIEDVAANGFNLNISRYVRTGTDDIDIDVSEEIRNLEDLIAQRNEAEAEMLVRLRKLNYVE